MAAFAVGSLLANAAVLLLAVAVVPSVGVEALCPFAPLFIDSSLFLSPSLQKGLALQH
jgi:hypothetical protein